MMRSPTETIDTSRVFHALQQTLVNVAVLAADTKQAHWNLHGPTFVSLHRYLDELAEVLRDDADLLAERLAAVGGSPDGRTVTLANTTTLDPFPSGPLGPDKALRALDASLGRVTADITESLDSDADPVTVQLFTTVLEHLEKHRWLIRSHE